MDKKQNFGRLLEHIGLNNDVRFVAYKDTIHMEVTIVPKKREYHIRLIMNELIPYDVFNLIVQKTEETLYSFVNRVVFSITAKQASLTSENVENYWRYVISEDTNIPSVLQRSLMSQVVNYLPNESTLRVVLDNDYVHEQVIRRQLQAYLRSRYEEIGLQINVVEFEYDDETAKEKQEEFVKQQNEAIQKLAVEAAQQLKETNDVKKVVAVELVNDVIKGRPINDEIVMPMDSIDTEARNVLFQGVIFNIEENISKYGRQTFRIFLTDYTNSFMMRVSPRNEAESQKYANYLKKGEWIKVRGNVEFNEFDRDYVLVPTDIVLVQKRKRIDTVQPHKKRVELHLHTKMSTADATNSISDYVKVAKEWGHTAIAVTDHFGLQAYPEAYAAGLKEDVKILYGVEANLVNIGQPIAYNTTHILLDDATYVAFDVETTGLSAVYDKIIELAAVKMYRGEIIDKFEAFIKIDEKLSFEIISLTNITDEMLEKEGQDEQYVMSEFLKFIEGSILVAHNASFDMGFITTTYRRLNMSVPNNPVIDTLALSRLLRPDKRSHRLNVLAKEYGVALEQHHRAIYDSEATSYINRAMLADAKERYNVMYHNELNNDFGNRNQYRQERPYHMTILVKNQQGLKDLFKIVSKSHIDYFYIEPRVPRPLIEQNRENLLIGSGCSQGEVFTAMMQSGYEVAKEKAEFYDYLEIMPKDAYSDLIKDERIKSEADLEEIIKNIVQLGKELNKTVVAVSNAHYLNKEDAIYRDILVSTDKRNKNRQINLPQVHFRTTDEMIRCFDFLSDQDRDAVVFENTQKIADNIEKVTPLKDKLYTPKIEGAEDEITQLSYKRARELYGEELPEIVQKRLDKELKSIIGNGFSVVYLISQKLVQKSVDDGYLVGSRGSVGSSFVATMTGITEVNPLAPHYRCGKCQYSEFFEAGEYGSGFDLPAKNCPVCQTPLDKDGQDIPFETFLGFHGDKVPDIDLNFSGDYQSTAHAYTKELFGEEYVYRAGTIGTIAEKTGFNLAREYQEIKNKRFRKSELSRLAMGVTDVKRTTGQHPGGIIVIPDYMDVYDFTPIQYPANSETAEWKTTHFDFHSIHDNVLKLDILGHDDPTVIRMLQDLSGRDPKTIPVDDPDVMKIFQGTEILGVEPEQIYSKTGTLGISEFGTQFVRDMLVTTKPKTFADLLQISGLSHGTDVYLGNAADLIKEGTATLSQVIGCRDDIMVYLIHAGLDEGDAFQIMESVRKGKGIPDEKQSLMREHKVPEWYIQSCLKIKYMFPKAHAAAYVLMALRVAYYKVHDPLLYYCAYFSVRAKNFDLVSMTQGKDMVKRRIDEINAKDRSEVSATDKELLSVLEIANEMLERGFTFKMVDLNKSDSKNFIIDGNSLIAPFRAVPSLGENVAKQIVVAREQGEFLSKEDLRKRGGVSKTILEYLNDNGVIAHLPDANQLSLFDF